MAEVYHRPLPENACFPTGSLDFRKELSSSSLKQRLKSRIQLNITIVGAGLGGLATAVALARHGHSVTVFEQACKLGEVGAGIQIPSNSSRLLKRWGVAEHLAPFIVEPHGINLLRWKDGKLIGKTQLVPDFQYRFGAPYYVIHRAHLHSALHRRAMDLGVDIQINSRVTEYRPETATIVLASGKTYRSDLVVAADAGVQSVAVPIVTGSKDKKVIPSGFAAYRATVDAAKIQNDPETAPLLETPGLNFWIGDQRHAMTYPIAGGTSYNMVLSHPETSDPSTWSQQDALTAMKREFNNWDPRLVKVIDMIDATMKWPLVTGIGLSNWVHPTNNLVVLGDAAHAMLPYMSQGAGMAIEDGAALAEVIHLASSLEQLPQCLDLWQRVRIKRTFQMQQASLIGAHIWHVADGPEQIARDTSMQADIEGNPTNSSANLWSDPVTQRWCYGYDAEREIQAEWGMLAQCHL
ncbi:uncharacterized protein Z520_06391 [Fonsecaea multimorphosa CBS 102226]|uniref:FAD-binding domain-containing protein n=1 Tax=Fonsecaea multimorphosa CBS 102226 TaxID=1442371 RepID=A0A0D2KLP5_9EURO|nr:uncharacterized protein Z520_06391 [Fonsecaea multimorphosa CBS 102226]KIX97613.1 hypothetical protein Z520_06391 [Fonsecaea multimorphosa CBS 102226]